MWSIFIKTIREKATFLITMCLVAFLTLWLYISLYPTVAKQADEYTKIMAQFSPEMWKIFGMTDGNFSLTSLEKFLSVEMFSFMWQIMAIIMFVSLGVGTIAGEIESGTMEILLSLPLARIQLLWSKYMTTVLAVLIFCAVSILCIIPMAEAYNIEYNASVYPKVFIVGTLFAVSGLSISYMCSCIFEKGRATMISVGIYLIMYIINIVSTLKENMENLKYLSFFYYLDLSKILSEDSISYRNLLVFACTTIIAMLIATIYFHRRDIQS